MMMIGKARKRPSAFNLAANSPAYCGSQPCFAGNHLPDQDVGDLDPTLYIGCIYRVYILVYIGHIGIRVHRYRCKGDPPYIDCI